MADGSPQLKSPLIAQGQDDSSSSPGVTMNGLDTVVVDGGTSGSITPSSQHQYYRSMWKLAYKDFLPSRKASPGRKQKFSDLIHKANDWLKKSPDVKVRSCETVTWMDKDERRLGDSELMVMTRRIADKITTYHQRGLRIWLIPTTDEHIHTKKIAYCDIIPDKNDTISSLVDKVNKRIDDFQLKGKIISIQTLWVTIQDNKIDSDVIKWTETETMNNQRAFVLRVFYAEEDAAKETVVLKDILPKATAEGYEDFDTLVTSANIWLKEQKDITLLNMQSVLVQKKHDSPEIPGNECFFAIPGPQSSNTAAPIEFIRMLRLVYCKSKPGKGKFSDSSLSPVTFGTFTPQWVQVQEGKTSSRRERVEKMKEVFKRAEEFLVQSGCDVLSAETVTNPMHVPSENEDTIPEIKWLFTLRLYLTSPPLKLEEPNFQREGISRGSFRHSTRRKKKEDDAQHPGPIFLRNVVNRQYRYRWVIVGVVAFVTMSLIVALSVIYANR